MNITNNTVSIHRYDASWYGERELYIIKLKRKLNNILGRNMANKIAVFIGTLKFDGLGIALNRVINRVTRL